MVQNDNFFDRLEWQLLVQKDGRTGRKLSPWAGGTLLNLGWWLGSHVREGVKDSPVLLLGRTHNIDGLVIMSPALFC